MATTPRRFWNSPVSTLTTSETMKTLLAFLVLASTALAQYPEPYPASFKDMTKEQREAWVDARNVQLRIEWEAKKAKSNQPQYLQGSVTTSNTEGKTAADDFCYRYFHQFDPIPTSSSTESTTVTYPTQYSNPAYVNPGPLTTISRYAMPWPSTVEEAAAIKKAYDEAEGEERSSWVHG